MAHFGRIEYSVPQSLHKEPADASSQGDKKLLQELEGSQPNAKEESCISMLMIHSSLAPCHLIPSGTFKHYLIGWIKENKLRNPNMMKM